MSWPYRGIVDSLDITSTYASLPLAYNWLPYLLHMHLLRDIFPPTRSPPPLRHTPSSRLIPFIIARDDKTRFPGIESATTDIFSRFDEGAPPRRLLRFCCTMQPRYSAHRSLQKTRRVCAALRALSDLHALFKPRSPRTAAKIVFYAAQVHRRPRPRPFCCAACRLMWSVGRRSLRRRARKKR
ncbi:hypothetical protein BJV77DRAFT_720096 [Russula vinacea]|nr:hypothetical protein BJV77DRAFT_720096 [Russula vinacea]